MRIVVDVNHPAQVHFFKNFIWEMERKGHTILVTVSKKEFAEYLLNVYNIKRIILNGYGDTQIKKILNVRPCCKIQPDTLPMSVN